MASIPATILTGFLGSGKTTLLKRVLTEAHGQKIAVIENEFGEENIDNEILVADTSEQIIQMNNGCVCCTIREDLRTTLADAGREEAQGRARLRPRGDRDHRPGRPRPGGADLLHGRRDRRELPARLDPDAGRRQARRAAARRRARKRGARSASPTRSSSARPIWSTTDEVDALMHRLKHMNPRAPQQTVHFGEVPIAERVRPARLQPQRQARDRPGVPQRRRRPRPRSPRPRPRPRARRALRPPAPPPPRRRREVLRVPQPTGLQRRPSWRTSWARSCRSTARRCCATRAC